MADRVPNKRLRVALGWLAGAAVLLIYLSLPEGEDANGPQPIPRARSAEDSQRLTITEVVPGDPAVGSALLIDFSGGRADQPARVWSGKTELSVLARRPHSLLAQLPHSLLPGHIKIRIAIGDERSKAYELHLKPVNWRKPFRNFCGGLALLVLGVHTLSRGARGVLGVSNVQRLATLSRSRFAALSVGAVAGSVMQSTTAVAGLLAGVVSSRALPEIAAAEVFVGAQLGAALLPLVVASTAEPRWGLPAIAVGTLAIGFANDRRARALARLILGAGLVAFGVQVLRPGFEPFVSNPLLLNSIDRLAASGLLGIAGAALLGALLIAMFQGPAPVLILALGIAELTGHGNLRSTLALLSGSGLGAGLAALLTTANGPGTRRLAQLNLFAGCLSTVFAAATIDLFSRLSLSLTADHVHAIWNGKHQLPAVSWPVAVAFALSQLTAALLLLLLLPQLLRLLEYRFPSRAAKKLQAVPSVDDMVRAGLSQALAEQQAALPALLWLVLHGSRGAGRDAEHHLIDARNALTLLFSGPVLVLPGTLSGGDLGRIAIACRQLQRSLEVLLEQAERLTENRLVWSDSSYRVPALSEQDQAVFCEVHGLIAEGVLSLLQHLRSGTRPDSDETRAREIQMNATESRTRHALLAERLDSQHVRRNLGVIELIDAYEAAGNQLYRLAETLSEAHRDVALPSSAAASAPNLNVDRKSF